MLELFLATTEPIRSAAESTIHKVTTLVADTTDLLVVLAVVSPVIVRTYQLLSFKKHHNKKEVLHTHITNATYNPQLDKNAIESIARSFIARHHVKISDDELRVMINSAITLSKLIPGKEDTNASEENDENDESDDPGSSGATND